VFVGDLFHFECAFERDWTVVAATDEEVRARVGVRLGDLGCLRAVEDRLYLVGEIAERGDRFARICFTSQCKREQIQSGLLACERLGGGDADFRAGADVQDVLTLSSCGGADGVGDCKCVGIGTARSSKRPQGVCSLAALDDATDECAAGNGDL
jgi:hypothetical protein